MKRMSLPLSALLFLFIVIGSSVSFAQTMQTIKLPAPDMSGGKPLMQALKDRQTTREFAERELPLEVMSNLLWAAFGINRPETGKRTAPSAVNWQETDIYVVTANGTYIYDAKEHALKPHVSGDIRALTGSQGFVGTAPVNLVYVADLSKMGNADETAKERTAYADTGFIAQNVYLFCASENLATVVRGLIGRPALAEALKLSPSQRITLAQTIGYHK